MILADRSVQRGVGPLGISGIHLAAALEQLLAHRFVAILRGKVDGEHVVARSCMYVRLRLKKQAHNTCVARPRREMQRSPLQAVHRGHAVRIRR